MRCWHELAMRCYILCCNLFYATIYFNQSSVVILKTDYCSSALNREIIITLFWLCGQLCDISWALWGCSSDISSLYFFPVQVKSAACYIKPNPKPNPNSFTSFVFHNKICVFIVVFTALSFLRLIFYEEECQLDCMLLM